MRRAAVPFAVPVPDRCPSRTARLRTRTRAAVVLWAAGTLVAGASLTACEYTFDEGGSRPEPAGSAAPAATDPVFTRDPRDSQPVSEAEMGRWLEEALPDTGREVIHTGHGLLSAGEVRIESAPHFPTGTYALALACKGQRRVNFTVRTDDYTMVDVGLRCGSSRENVVYLSRDSVLTFRLEARSAANYAYRLIRR